MPAATSRPSVSVPKRYSPKGGESGARRRPSGALEARIEKRVENTPGQVPHHDGAGREEEDAEEQVQIAREERLKGQEPDPRPAEDRPPDEGAAQQPPGLQPRH